MKLGTLKKMLNVLGDDMDNIMLIIQADKKMKGYAELDRIENHGNKALVLIPSQKVNDNISDLINEVE